MRGDFIYAIQVIIFTFVFMGYLYFILKRAFPKADRVEHLGCSLLISFMVTCMVTIISMIYLENIYFHAWPLFWFIEFSMALCIASIEINIVKISLKKLNELEKT